MNTRVSSIKKVWRIIDIIRWAEEYFSSRNFESPRKEIEWLLRELLQCSRVDIYLRFEEPLSNAQLEILREGVKRRIKHEPLQYITGATEFYSLKFIVTPDVLIPRPETERLVDAAIHSLKPQEKSTILDIGTGSGCIAIALAREYPESRIIATDVTKEALEIAKKNAKLNEVTNIEFVQQDFLKDFTLDDKIDILVTNPPYVTKEEFLETMPDVQNYEPRIALTDGGNGLTFYKRIAELASSLMNKNGVILMEVGIGDHPQKVADIFDQPDFEDIEFIQDFNGDDRVVHVKYSGQKE